MVTTNLFRINRQFKDEAFDIEQIGRYRLSYRLADNAFTAAAFDNKSNGCILFEQYVGQEDLSALSPEELSEQVRTLISGHHLFSAGYWKEVLWISPGDTYALVPAAFFKESNAIDYLQLNAGKVSNPKQVYSFKCLAEEQVCLFEEHLPIVDFLEKQYASTTLLLGHDTGLFLEGVFKQQTAQLHELSVLVSSNQIVVLNLNAKNLRFLNIFSVNIPEDILYFLLSVADSLSIRTDQLAITLYGNLNEGSNTYQLLKRYIKEVRFGKRPEQLRFSPQFEGFADFASHRFFALFSSSLIQS